MVILEIWQYLPGGGQLAAFLSVWFVLWLPIASLTAWVFGWRRGQPLVASYKLPLLASLYLLVPPLLWGLTQLGEATWQDWGLRLNGAFAGSLAVGILLGVLGLAIVFGLETRCGWLAWHREKVGAFLGLLPTILLLALWISLTEETLFRGVFVTFLQPDLSWGTIAILISTLFALSHLLWERHETPPQLAGLWLMGMVLMLARVVNHGGLGLAIGLHAGWIWGLTCLAESKIMTYRDRAPLWWVGWQQQPLAGAGGIFCLWGTAMVLGAIVML